jgi:hypothetical protein
MDAHKAGLSAADARTIKHQAQVGGNPHPSGMGNPLAIKDDHIRLSANLPEGFD